MDTLNDLVDDGLLGLDELLVQLICPLELDLGLKQVPEACHLFSHGKCIGCLVHQPEPSAGPDDVLGGGELPDGLQELLRRPHVRCCDLQSSKVYNVLAELEFLGVEDNSIPGTQVKIFTSLGKTFHEVI